MAAQKASLEELPAARRARFVAEYGLSPAAAAVLTAHPAACRFFERAARLHGDAVKVANFLQTEVLRDVKTAGLAATFPVSEAQLAELLALVDEKTISGKQAKEVYAKIAGTPASPRKAVAESGFCSSATSASSKPSAGAFSPRTPSKWRATAAARRRCSGFSWGR